MVYLKLHIMKKEGVDKLNSKEIEAEIKALEDEKAQSANEVQKSELEEKITAKREEYWKVKTLEEEQTKSERVELAKEGVTSHLLRDEAYADMPPNVIKFAELCVELAVKTEQEANAAEKAELVNKYEDKIRTLINQSMETEDQLATTREVNRILQVEHEVRVEEIRQLNVLLDERYTREKELCISLNELTVERDDAFEKRGNAVREANEARNENERLEAQIAEYQSAKVFGEKEAQKIITVQSNDKLKELAEQIIKEYKVTADVGLYKEITDAEGNKEVVRITDLTGLNIVSDFTSQTIVPLSAESFGIPEPLVLPDSFPETQTNGSPVDQGNVNREMEAQAVGTDSATAEEPADETEVVADMPENTWVTYIQNGEKWEGTYEDYKKQFPDGVGFERLSFVTTAEFKALVARVSALENSPKVLKGDEAA